MACRPEMFGMLTHVVAAILMITSSHAPKQSRFGRHSELVSRATPYNSIRKRFKAIKILHLEQRTSMFDCSGWLPLLVMILLLYSTSSPTEVWESMLKGLQLQRY